MTPNPSADEIRRVLLEAVNHRYKRGGALPGGMRGFAQDAGLPYDRVRDHLKGETEMDLSQLIGYLGVLELTLNDLATRAEALR